MSSSATFCGTGYTLGDGVDTRIHRVENSRKCNKPYNFVLRYVV